MDSNFPQTPYPDVVQRALPFEAGVDTLHSLPLGVESLPARHSHLCTASPQQRFMRLVDLDNGFSPKLSVHQSEKVNGTVASIGHEEARMEPARRIPTLSKHIGSPSHIMDVARTHIGCYGKLSLAVNKQVEFPAVGKLFDPLGSLLNIPASILVGLWVLPSIAPAFQRSAVYGDTFPEARDFIVAATYQSAGNIFHLSSHPVLGKPSEESRKGCLVRNEVRRGDATCLSDKGVVDQGSDKGGRRLQSQDIPSDQAMPENFAWMALRPNANRACKSFQEGFVVQGFKDSVKLGNNWRCLNGNAKDGIIKCDHLA